ncbi:M1 family metallopeptidase [Occultella gossypii]|uniref:Aminopeptidase N n=1 Tax=Occultella gossypii TaxID=2800820 RepID=A0ABS7SER8_9MICO|nr:M1 family metallopeptidase [Occultella gossypii]MBZ2198620.1 M1 family metallopeptidase [Occultella gossypii]
MSAPAGADHYVPGHGDTSYSVHRYELEIEYRPGVHQLTGTAVITAVAETDLTRFALDLHALRVTKVRLDAAHAKYTHRSGRLVIKPREQITAGTAFTVTVHYDGPPETVPGIDGEAGFEELEDGAIIASQPHGAPSWFPCNDRPSDKASYAISVTVPNEYLVVANGTSTGSRRRSSRTTWTFDQPEPMATYLATVQIGRYTISDDGGSPALRIAQPAGSNGKVKATFGRQREMMRLFERLYGPYPFACGYTVVVTPDDLEIPLEAQGLSIFGANHLSTDWETQRLVAHEMSHQWFGNSLTLQHWSDIWLHEGFACYSEWLWSEAGGGPSAAEHAARQAKRLAALDQDLVLADPGPELMFDDRIYKRGALALHALRLRIGDEPFFDLLRTWAITYRHGGVTTQLFTDLAQERTGVDLEEFFTSWLWSKPLPPLDPATGRRRKGA